MTSPISLNFIIAALIHCLHAQKFKDVFINGITLLLLESFLRTETSQKVKNTSEYAADHGEVVLISKVIP